MARFFDQAWFWSQAAGAAALALYVEHANEHQSNRWGTRVDAWSLPPARRFTALAAQLED
jgi:hypothetical protein